MYIPDTNRPGSAVADGNVSNLVNVTLAAAASAFLKMKTRPVLVAAHNVPVSLGARSTAATVPRERSPKAAEVSDVAPAGPMATKSPQLGSEPLVVNSGQFVSR